MLKENRRKVDGKALKGYAVCYIGGVDGYRVWMPELYNIILSYDLIFKHEISLDKQLQDNDEQ